MIERLEKLGDGLMGEVVIGAHLTRGENPYKGGEEDCLVVVFSPKSTNLEQTNIMDEIRRQGFSIDDFFWYIVIFERQVRACKR